MSIVNCISCGSQNNAKHKVCIKCGESLQKLAEKSEAELLKSDVVVCPTCSFENGAATHFCIKCGASIKNVAPSQQKEEPRKVTPEFVNWCLKYSELFVYQVSSSFRIEPDLIESFADKWNLNQMTKNYALPWSESLIEKYSDKWDFGFPRWSHVFIWDKVFEGCILFPRSKSS